MTNLELIRTKMLSAPAFTFVIDDRVLCRNHPADHEFAGRVVATTTERQPRYDVRDDTGRLHLDVPFIRLDEAALVGMK